MDNTHCNENNVWVAGESIRRKILKVAELLEPRLYAIPLQGKRSVGGYRKISTGRAALGTMRLKGY